VVTNCHVLAKAKAVQVRRDNVVHEAKLEFADAERDLCTLTVKDFTAPAVVITNLSGVRIGHRVYAVGNPERLFLTLSEGLVSGLRTEDPRLPPLQTTAPISPGSSGGGLFDDQGRLLGITTLMVLGRQRVAQNLNFAIPAEWLAEVPERAKAALAARKPPAPAPGANPGAPGLPVPGANYRYQWADRQNSRQQDFSVQVTAVDGANVTESFGAPGRTAAAATVAAREPVFIARNLGEGRSMLEFAPYFPTERPDDAQSLQSRLKYAGGESASVGPWSYTFRIGDWEKVSVPAGTYRALRVEIGGTRQRMGLMFGATRFAYTAWYSPDVGRYVRMRHQSWSPNGPIGDDHVELLEFRPN
jgi:hypothetical protein